MSMRVIMDKSEYEELIEKAKEADDTADFIREIIDENRRQKMRIKTLQSLVYKLVKDKLKKIVIDDSVCVHIDEK